MYNTAYTNATHSGKAPEVNEPVQVKDQLQISSEAKIMNQQTDRAKDLGEIKERVKSGFYFSDEVTNKVAEGLLKDIKNMG